jgi:hypothetical protein
MKTRLLCLILVASSASFGKTKSLVFSARCTETVLASSAPAPPPLDGTDKVQRYLFTFALADWETQDPVLDAFESFALTQNARIALMLEGDSKKLPSRIRESNLYEVHTETFGFHPDVSASFPNLEKSPFPLGPSKNVTSPLALRLIAHPGMGSGSFQPIGDASGVPRAIVTTGAIHDLSRVPAPPGCWTEHDTVPLPGAVFVEWDSTQTLRWKSIEFYTA